MIEKKEYMARRRQLLKQIGAGSIGVVFAANEKLRTIVTPYPYRQNSDFYYLTGFNEPEAVAVFIPGRKEGEFVLFNRERDMLMEIWNGYRAGQSGACKYYGADQAFPISKIDQIMPSLLGNKRVLYLGMERNCEFDPRVMRWLEATHKNREGINIPREFINIGKILHEMRLRKSKNEVAAIRKAIAISKEAYLSVMHVCRPGMFEYELEAELLYKFVQNGGRYTSFEPIVAGGASTCVLHYVNNNARLRNRELVLIDSGVEYDCYSSDITRTIPVNGKFSAEQKAIYQAVLATQMAVINEIRPGVRWTRLENIAEQVITKKLLELKILRGNFKDLLKKKAFRKFYMHHIGHWLGLDNKDPGLYKPDDWRILKSGMVFTVEPGIYITKSKTVDKKWWNIGIRIEDNVLVTANGCEILSKDIPKTITEIEKIMQR